MADQPGQTTTQEEPARASRSFVVEFGDDCNRTISINTLTMRVRGRFSIVNIHTREGGGRDIGRMNAMPDIPGLRMRVDADQMVATLYDPLENEPDLRERILVVMRNCNISDGADRLGYVKRTEHKLNDDQLKTLLLELDRKVNDKPKHAKLVEGFMPTRAQIEELDGRQLNDPWSNSPRKPKYKDQVEDWEAQIDKSIA